MSILPRFTTRAATDERIKVCLQKREPQRTHARSVLVCWCFLGPPARVPWFVVVGGSASAVFSAARFRFPFESLSYIFEYGIGALLVTWRARLGNNQRSKCLFLTCC